MITKIGSLELFEELRTVKSITEIAKNLDLHLGTLRRWIEKNEVPNDYSYDFNRLLNYKYDNSKISTSFRDKDQFFTTKTMSFYCFQKLLEVLKKLEINEKEYNYIEPSVGCCNFYDILPRNRKIGIDIEPKGDNELIKSNYLDFEPKNKKNIVIGNPPFGLRGNLALRFINHSNKFADIVAFILPPLFDSDGKGVPSKRVKGYELAHTEKLPLNSFEYPDGTPVEVATIFQVWTKVNIHKIKKERKFTCDSFIKVYSLSDGGTPSSTRNKKMLDKCDVYLPSTCFSNMNCFNEFEKLPHRRGYGIVFLKEKEKLTNLFFSINWESVSFLSTNSAMNLRKGLIEKEIIKKGFKDEIFLITRWK